jgi:hypothetical protein
MPLRHIFAVGHVVMTMKHDNKKLPSMFTPERFFQEIHSQMMMTYTTD